MTQEKLAHARKIIDQIDRDIHALLQAREREVETVNSAKRSSNLASKTAYRPFREASMMQRLINEHKQAFPFKSVEHIWREMIAGFTQLQQNYNVHMLQANFETMDMARFHFGFATPLMRHETLSDMTTALLSQPADLLLWPLADDIALFNELINKTGAKIVNQLPSFHSSDFVPCLVLAVCELEKHETANNYYLVNISNEGLAPIEQLNGAQIVMSCSDSKQALIRLRNNSDEERKLLDTYNDNAQWIGNAPQKL